MTAATPAGATADPISLQPRPWVPLGVMVLAFPVGLSPVGWWGAGPLLAFGLVLLGQAAVLRLCFTADALVVERAGQAIRRFPYADWQGWRLFWGPLPVLFWFREVRSIHLLPHAVRRPGAAGAAGAANAAPQTGWRRSQRCRRKRGLTSNSRPSWLKRTWDTSPVAAQSPAYPCCPASTCTLTSCADVPSTCRRRR